MYQHLSLCVVASLRNPRKVFRKKGKKKFVMKKKKTFLRAQSPKNPFGGDKKSKKIRSKDNFYTKKYLNERFFGFWGRMLTNLSLLAMTSSREIPN